MKTYLDGKDITIYLSYLNNKLYAWTKDKKYHEEFKRGRNNKFKHKKIVIDDEEYLRYNTSRKQEKLLLIPLENDGKSISVIGTYHEDMLVNIRAEKIINEIDDVHYYMKGIVSETSIPNDIVDALRNLICRGFHMKGNILKVDINSFLIFFEMFADTF